MTNADNPPTAAGDIPDTLAHLAVDMHTLSVHPRNPNKGNVQRIAESLRTLGQFRAITYQQSTGHILTGNHTFLAARSLGWLAIAATALAVDDETALRIVIMDNRAAEWGERDNTALVELLTELDNAGGLDGTGYDDQEFSRLLDKIADDLLGNEGDADVESPSSVWGVVIDCTGEEEQFEVLARLSGEGLRVRALMG